MVSLPSRLSKLFAIFLIVIIISAISSYFKSNHIDSHPVDHRRARNLLSVSRQLNDSDVVSDLNLTLTPESTQPSTNCVNPAISNFPQIPPDLRNPATFIFFCLISIYMFIAIAIVCDEYFVPSLDVICDTFKLESDVAGSTFMAIGSSAPELAASVIGVFIARDDIGVGAVVGSAVFNIAFVISLCALFAGQVIHLHWWPLSRDCFFYFISICALFFSMLDEVITWYESTILLVLYLIYIAFMTKNRRIEMKVKQIFAYLTRGFRDLSLAVPGDLADKTDYKQMTRDRGQTESSIYDTPSSSPISSPINSPVSTDVESNEDINDDKLSFSYRICNLKGLMKKIWNILASPIRGLSMISIPDCSKESMKKYFMVTFIMSCVWISIYSYILVWMITVIGFELSIPDTVMGLIFISAGVSIPDAIASLIVVRDGFGDMALTNAIASNVFDILICLGLPWFIQTAIIDPGSTVRVVSRGLEYSTLSLLSTIAFFLISTHLNGWRLTKRYGIALMVWYFAFMTLSTLYELNVFGQFNLPTCFYDK